VPPAYADLADTPAHDEDDSPDEAYEDLRKSG
jgi:hypothetical protein